jgi:parvulin-like peptidyl-prolyl isomerase
MRRFCLLISAAVLAAALSACGSSSSSSAKLGPNDVAVVNGVHITKDQLNHWVAITVAIEKQQGQTPPKPGTSAYQTEIVKGTAQQLVFEQEVRDIAKKLGVTASQSEVQARIDDVVKKSFGGSRSKFQKFLTSAKMSQADLVDDETIQVLESKIEAKLKGQVKITDAEIRAYYLQNPNSYLYVIDSSSLHGTGPFQASLKKGQLETNFQNAARTLADNQLSQPVAVSKSYMQSQLAGKCKPQCYFLIRPTGPAKPVKGVPTRPVDYMLVPDLATATRFRAELAEGKSWQVVAAAKQPLSKVQSQIRSTLLGQKQSSYVSGKVQALLAAEKKLVQYAPAYKPAPLPSTTTSSSTATT